MSAAFADSIGVTVGKFNPPHLGHASLIEKAARHVQHLYVLLGDHPGQTIAAELRRSWLLEASPPNVTILITPDDLPAANEPWAARALQLLPVAPRFAFTSEDWGPGWAALMGATHVMIDRDRRETPISASAIRSDLGRHFHWLVPAARASLARRVVIVGAESTGKTTIAESLAREFQTVWVPEYGRWYWEGRRYSASQTWTTEEFRRIATGQRRLEDDLARRAMRGLLICDTDALVTAVWHERYCDTTDPELEALLPTVTPDLYLICCPDFDWVQDGTRESASHRDAMHHSVLARVHASRVRHALLSGSHDERMAQARSEIEPLLSFAPLS